MNRVQDGMIKLHFQDSILKVVTNGPLFLILRLTTGSHMNMKIVL